MKIKVPLQKNKSKAIEVEVITTGAIKPAADGKSLAQSSSKS